MASFYWVGKTGNGNVNLASNWSLWATGGTSLPPEALTIPKYNDSVIFNGFTITTGTGGYPAGLYPIYGPSGNLNGLCGPSGNTAGQYLVSLTVNDSCGVPLGTTAVPFTVGAQNVTINTSANMGYIAPYFLSLKNNTGLTQLNSVVSIRSGKSVDFNIKGIARSIKLNNTTTIPSYATLILKDIELSDIFETISDSINSNNAYDQIYIYPSVTASTAAIRINGKGTVINIYKGFAWSEPSIYLNNYTSVSTDGPTLKFVAEGASGATGPTSTTRSYVKKLATYSTSKESPTIYVEHGVDIDTLNMNGGQIHFLQDLTNDGTIVQRGSFNSSNSRLSSRYGSVSLGVNGDFVVANNTDVVPDMKFDGPHDYYIISYSGYSGPGS
jgi:hypothetical protein